MKKEIYTTNFHAKMSDDTPQPIREWLDKTLSHEIHMGVLFQNLRSHIALFMMTDVDKFAFRMEGNTLYITYDGKEVAKITKR